MLRIALVLLTALTAAQAQPDQPGLRLPGGVRPLSYEVDLRLVPGEDDFSGRVRIEIELQSESSIAWLHAKDLTFHSAMVSGAPAKIGSVGPDFAAVSPPAPVPAGRATLEIEYTGKVSRTLTDGIFQQRDGGDWYVFTKFEPVTARRAFPCFDEPGFKAPWQLTLHIPSALKAFSNTPVQTETAETGGMKTVRFARTKPLPSYLVAFGIGPFDVVDVAPIGRNRVPGHIVAPRGRGAEAAAAAAETPQAIALLEDYFGIPYPYEKLDQIVVPLTTSWGAMENAGLIAYNQILLTKPGEDSEPRRRSRADAMVHEMAHQWFGDLVTAAWWDDIWLNEGFAVWLTSKLLDRWHPEWKIRSGWANGMNAAMQADALVSARTVRQPIEAPGDIALAFDGITYVKGAAILRTFENWLGENTFRNGVRAYLGRHAWGSATTLDFLAALSGAAGRDVAPAFSSLLDQRGAPLVKADIRCDAPRPVLRLSQERFVPIGSTASASAVWNVPVCVRFSDGKSGGGRQCVLLDKQAAEVPLEGATSCPAWFLANDNAMGYYRSAYEGAWFKRLLESGAAALQPNEKMAFLQNVQALLTAGKIDPGDALDLAVKFGGSGDREIVRASLRIAGLIMQVVPEDFNAKYVAFLRGWLGPRARQLGWRPKRSESEDTKEIRLAIVPLVAIGAGDEELGAEARRLAEAWLDDRGAIDRDTAGVILVAAARHGDRTFFDRLVSELRKTKDQVQRYNMIAGLGAFRDPQLERAALELVLHGGEGIDPREAQGVITPQWNETRQIVWEYVKRNFDELNARLPGARGIPYGATLPRAAGGFCDEAHAADVESFFGPRLASLSGGARNLAGVVENIRLCAARRAAFEPGVRKFLAR